MKHLKNKLFNIEKVIVDKYEINDYFSFKYQEFIDYINSLPINYFNIYEIKEENTTMDMISMEIYGTSDYSLFLYLINGINPLLEGFYNFDVIDATAEEHINKYKNKTGRSISLRNYANIKNELLNKENRKNNIFKKINYIKNEYIRELDMLLYEKGIIKK